MYGWLQLVVDDASSISVQRVMRSCRWMLIAAATVLFPTAPQAVASETAVDLIARVEPSSAAVAGSWNKNGDELTTSATTSSRLMLPLQPRGEYDFEVEFTRRSGIHSIALLFPMGRGQASYEVDAWGEHLAGIQLIEGKDIRANASRKANVTLINGRRYKATVQVRKTAVRVSLDDQIIATITTTGDNLSMLDAWKLPQANALGIGAYEAETTFHRITYREINGGGSDPRVVSSNPATANANASPQPNPGSSRPAMTRPEPAATNGSRPRASGSVLLVIANHHFFYREYAEPKEELERAGFKVVTAASRRGACIPHENSGQSGNGTVQAEIALADVRSNDYVAIVFVGGWGASVYQYAFRGNYSTSSYNGDTNVKAIVNRLINEFSTQNKWIGGICHGVSVLAWSRVNGKSLIEGKRVTAAELQGPQGIYNGQAGQPPSRWNAEINRAQVAPANSVGDRNSPHDDVMVDGHIITAADDRAARAFGAELAKQLQ